jgi:hypothetical protein
MAEIRLGLQRDHLQPDQVLAHARAALQALQDLPLVQYPPARKVRDHGVHLQLLRHLPGLYRVDLQLRPGGDVW